MTANKGITPDELRAQAQQLIDSCGMPSVDEVLKAVFETRRKYLPQILAARSGERGKPVITVVRANDDDGNHQHDQYH